MRPARLWWDRAAGESRGEYVAIRRELDIDEKAMKKLSPEFIEQCGKLLRGKIKDTMDMEVERILAEARTREPLAGFGTAGKPGIFEPSSIARFVNEIREVDKDIQQKRRQAWSLDDSRKAANSGLMSKPKPWPVTLLTRDDLLEAMKSFSFKDMFECDPRSDEARRADLSDGSDFSDREKRKAEAEENKRERWSRMMCLGIPMRLPSFHQQIVCMPEIKKQVQFRFPRSKKKRIRKKWAKSPANWRDEVIVVEEPAMLNRNGEIVPVSKEPLWWNDNGKPTAVNVKKAWLEGEWNIEHEPLEEGKS